MDEKKFLKLAGYILFAGMFILAILFFFDIKFVVFGLNILVWDVLAVGIWIFVRLCRWAGRANTGKRMLAVGGITLLALFASATLWMAFAISGCFPGYVEQTEPQTHRTFVVEYTSNLMNHGSAKLYERFGPFLLACDVEEYAGEFLLERPEDRSIYVSEDGKSIVVAYFFLRPIFIVPLE